MNLLTIECLDARTLLAGDITSEALIKKTEAILQSVFSGDKSHRADAESMAKSVLEDAHKTTTSTDDTDPVKKKSSSFFKKLFDHDKDTSADISSKTTADIGQSVLAVKKTQKQMESWLKGLKKAAPISTKLLLLVCRHS